MSYIDKVKIQYFEERRCTPGDQYWVLKENDFDSREKEKKLWVLLTIEITTPLIALLTIEITTPLIVCKNV